ncbi:hypothetical protein KR054_009533, partial [Drosophila jambulina]
KPAGNYSFKASVFIPQTRVAFANSSHAGLHELMETALGNLGINKSQIYGFENCDAMRTNATFEHYLASVCFHNENGDKSKNGLPQKLRFSIIMPYEVRNYEHTRIGGTWEQSRPTVGRLLNKKIEGSDEYLGEGFVPLQYYISREYVRMASRRKQIPGASLRPMSSLERGDEKFSESSVTTAIIIMVLGFMFPVIILVKLIVEEHELGQCFVLEVNNAGRCLQISAWFFNACMQLLITSLFLGLMIMYTSPSTPSTELLFAIPFFASYSISVASFIIFLSAIIRSTKLALVLVPILWFLLPFPFLFTEQLKLESSFFFYLLATFLMCNVTLSRGLSLLIIFDEQSGTESVTHNIVSEDNFLNLGFPALIGIFFIQTLIYSLLVPIIQFPEWVLVWRYLKSIPRKCRMCCRSRKRSDLKDSLMSANEIEAGIEFRQVSKKYLTTYVVRRFTLSVFPGEVVVLLGHNASGKSTIMRMMRGWILPTHGEIFVAGVNMVKNNLFFNKKSHRRVGISLTTNSLFVELTVFDHLVFFSRLRGLQRDEAQAEVGDYMRSLQMEDIEGVLVKNLSIGQKRIVQSMCAFVGRTKIVVLHKPLDGVDEATANLFFSFVQREKRNRSIFVTSNRSKVAKGLGDRIGILVNGRMMFLGTERQLCRQFNDVYRLTIYGNAHCDFDIVRKFLEHYTKHRVEVESKLGDLAVFLINRIDFPGLIRLLNELPKNKGYLKIDGFKIQECSLDQILIDWFTPEPFRFALHETEQDYQKGRIKYEALKKFLRRVSHFLIVLRHRALIDIYNAYFLIIKILLPMFMTMWLGLCIRHHPTIHSSLGHKAFPISDPRSSGITFAQKGTPFDTDVALNAAYNQYITAGAKEVDAGLDITSIKGMRQTLGTHTNKKILATVRFNADGVEALYNKRWNHAAPHSLALVMNSLAVGFVGPDSGIRAELETMPFAATHSLNLYNVPLLTISVLCFSLCFVWTMPMLYMNLSQSRRFNYIELIAGMRLSVLASAILLYELLVFVFAFVTFHLVIIILGMDHMMYEDFFLVYTHIIVLVALCVLSTNVLISLGSTITQNAYLLVLTFHTVGIISYLFVREFSISTVKYVYIFMDFYPLFSMMDHIMIISKVSENKWLCRDLNIYAISVHVEKCKKKPNCCGKVGFRFMKICKYSFHSYTVDPANEYNLHHYVVCNYIFMFLVWILIYFRIRASLPKTTSRQGRYTWDSDADSYADQHLLHFDQPTDLQNTWLGEKSRVRTLERTLIWDRSLHVGHLSVLFDKFVAINKINFMLDKYAHQVLSLYGPNGSGKTVLTKAILGIYAANTGAVSSPNRMPYQKYKSQIGNLAGYSAQEVFLMQELTIMDVLSLVLRIRHWVRSQQLRHEATMICKILNLYDYRNHILSTCSQGVLKRLSIALALMTNAELILLDDPFANLDVITQHTVLQSIQDARRHGLCIIYTCADTDFSTPAQRLAAISQSALIGIGERHELTHNYYSSYYVVETKIHLANIEALMAMSPEEDEGGRGSVTAMREARIYMGIRGFILRTFPKAIVNPKLVSYPRTCFWLPSQNYSVSQIFQKLHRNQDKFYSFTIGQPTVGTIFLHIAPEELENKPRDF